MCDSTWLVVSIYDISKVQEFVRNKNLFFKPGVCPQSAVRLWACAWFLEIVFQKVCVCVCMYACVFVCFSVPM